MASGAAIRSTPGSHPPLRPSELLFLWSEWPDSSRRPLRSQVLRAAPAGGRHLRRLYYWRLCADRAQATTCDRAPEPFSGRLRARIHVMAPRKIFAGPESTLLRVGAERTTPPQ